jgi:GrpB-like predicted nucleotidyltransferase (UPF0157 family)
LTRRTVVVVDYDDGWSRLFETLRARIWPVIDDVAVRIEHVGGTSVTGLPSKPIVDMTVVVRDRPAVRPVIARLGTIGYCHRGNLGIEDREAFDHPSSIGRHHLYVCPEGATSLVNQLTFRDYLRAQPDVAREYGNLKKALAARFPDDIDAYMFGKTDFIIGVLRRVGLTEDMISSIERCNRPAGQA